jgi:hypothetical protein
MNVTNYSYDMSVDKAYIIRIKENQISENMANRCANSCDSVSMPYAYWDAYNGLGNTIMQPTHHTPIVDLIKITNHYLTRGEVACALSHISLWAKCVLQDKPLVVLEHDAIMIAPYKEHGLTNSICYLGGTEQARQGWKVLPTPPHGSDGPNYRFICRAHAYAIDPWVAKNMLSHVIKFGIHISLDMMIRADIFPIHQMGLFAYDMHGETTIKNRKELPERNDTLIV